MRKTFRTLPHTVLLAGILFLAACAPAAKTPALDPNAVLTEAAATVAFSLTEEAAKMPTATQTNTPAPTNTPEPATPTGDLPTAPAAVTNTPNTPAPAATQPPAAGSTEDGASFVEDVTVPDGTGAAPGATFDKTWRIKNTGKTTWNSAYSIVFIDGERMNAPDSVAIPIDVRPNETVDVTVRLTAPTKSGSYQAFFRLRNDKGKFFKLDGSGDLWVKISVGLAATNTPESQATPTETTAPAETQTPES